MMFSIIDESFMSRCGRFVSLYLPWMHVVATHAYCMQSAQKSVFNHYMYSLGGSCVHIGCVLVLYLDNDKVLVSVLTVYH